MKTNDYYLLNAFTGEHAKGNQAVVLQLDNLSDSKRLQAIARDFNLPATTFLKQKDHGYEVRWFAPDGEILLCGHGTIAATWVLTQLESSADEIAFEYGDGIIIGSKVGDRVQIQADAIPSSDADIPDHVRQGFRDKVTAYSTSSNKHIVVLESEQDVRNMKPDWDALRTSNTFSYAITAASDQYDCVSRVILPHISILEDQATGSAHMVLAPYWAEKLGKDRLRAFQASRRGGYMECEVDGDRVRLSSACKVFAKGVLM